jgi:hypothetical protein
LRRVTLSDVDWGTELYRRKLPDNIRSNQLRWRQLSDTRRRKLRTRRLPDIRRLADLPSGELPTADDAEHCHVRSESVHDGLRQWTKLWWSTELPADRGAVAELWRHANVRDSAMYSDNAG